jgi:hypothetical protein
VNRFGATTFPNSNSNRGVPSLITIKDFSRRSARMTCTIAFGDNGITPLAGFPRNPGRSWSDNSPQWIDNALFVSKGDSVYAFRIDGTSKTQDFAGLFAVAGGTFPLAAVSTSSGLQRLVGMKDSVIYAFLPSLTGTDSAYATVSIATINTHRRNTTPPVTLSTTPPTVAFGNSAGGVTTVDPVAGTVVSDLSVSTAPVIALVYDGQAWYAQSSERIQKQTGEHVLFASSSSGFFFGCSEYFCFVDTIGRTVATYDKNLNPISSFSLTSFPGAIASPIAADINRDGNQEILLLAGRLLLAMTKQGTMLDGFPLSVGDELNASSWMAVRDLGGDNDLDILVVGGSGVLRAFTSSGKQKTGFAIDLGAHASSAPSIFQSPRTGNIAFAVSTDSGTVRAWEISAAYRAVGAMWTQRYHDSQHSNFAPAYSGNIVPLSTEFLPRNRVYNWPNPVYGRTTQIR